MQPRPSESSQKISSLAAHSSPLYSTQDGVDVPRSIPASDATDSLESDSGAVYLGDHATAVEPLQTSAVIPQVDDFERLNAAEFEPLPIDDASHDSDRFEWETETASDTLDINFHTESVSRSHDGRHFEDLPNEVIVHVLTHLPPYTLSTITLVSRRFYDLVTTPHAWRIAFCRHFPGPETISSKRYQVVDGGVVSSKREFTRLSPFATWRSEYILRPKLLDALRRGKPSHILVPAGNSRNNRANSSQNSAQITYPSRLFSPVDSLHCNFHSGPSKRFPRIVHGASISGKASTSDPLSTKVEKVDYWGSGDPQQFDRFEERYPADALYGRGPGSTVGVPNSMDVSQVHGMVIGEGYPGGGVYYRSVTEQRGRHLVTSEHEGCPENGIPRLEPTKETTCCVWIAKTHNIPHMTGGMIGLLSGSSFGIITAYSAGPIEGTRGLSKGEITARWVLSPGVPIISVAVDDHYSLSRLGRNRIWAVALNALGELFYLSDLPTSGEASAKASTLAFNRYKRAWSTGRTVYWSFIEPSRRTPKADLTPHENAHATYSPRSSWEGMKLEENQIAAETTEIEQYIRRTPKQIQELCDGWDMRRRLEVDFSGYEENDAGEAIFVFECGLEEDDKTVAKRFRRLRIQNTSPSPSSSPDISPLESPKPEWNSIFGSDQQSSATSSLWSFNRLDSERPASPAETVQSPRSKLVDIWRETKLSLGGLKDPTITCTAIDNSAFALITSFEDPLLSMTASNSSTPHTTPSVSSPQYTKPSEVVGQGARFIAAGTALGTILVWNARSPSNSTKPIRPVRIITTPDIRRISCLALTALYLVHGDSEGVVQAWDTLASTTQPIRTLHSRFSSRHRRQLNEQIGLPPGSHINLFGAGIIALDPDPTILRGVVSLGNQLHYWSYSSSDAAKYKPGKRRLRRSPRGSNQTPDRIGRLGKDQIKDYISKEQAELERDNKARHKESRRLAGRFGTDLLGSDATEEEILAYATMLSQEAAISDQAKAWSETASVSAATDTLSSPSLASVVDTLEDHDPDLAAAMLLSLHDNIGGGSSAPAQEQSQSPVGFDIPLRYAKNRSTKSPSVSPPGPTAVSSGQQEMDELEYALQLSRAEAESLTSWQEEFPAIERSSSENAEYEGKGKGRELSS